ncbi:MAG TPA: hypothetical protein DEU95_06275 [Chloroflexi bacterium]|jgi:hypothetical protein|nr:hypothetical protein [Chloroflexota bacterium]HCG29342.1 hypothetical protein [Chloroflexota bacterium]
MTLTVPTSYTREMLSAWLHTVAGPSVAGVLGWSAPSSYDEIINDALFALGGTAPDDVADIAALRAAARVALWQAVVEQTTTLYDVTMPDGVRVVRNQIQEQALAALRTARRAAMEAGVTLAVGRAEWRQSSPFDARQAGDEL